MPHTVPQLIIYTNTFVYLHTENTHTYMTKKTFKCIR